MGTNTPGARFAARIAPALTAILQRTHPGATLKSVAPLAVDASADADGTLKSAGYGVPLRLTLQETEGPEFSLVFHTATANVFGHQRRADRAEEMIGAFDTFGDIPRHAVAVDMGAIGEDGASLLSLANTGEFYLLTEWVPGAVYAEDLREIARRGRVTAQDLERVDTLANYLASLHAHKPVGQALYRRAVRDLIGSGEGLYGIIDGYPDAVGAPSVTPARLAAIEQAAARYRWTLRAREHRLARTHGDFHPFNIVFDPAGGLRLLDASRGCTSEPADDVTALAINYLFFALPHPESWSGAFSTLWYRFWEAYLSATGDEELLDVAAPFFAWRGLVLANPAWYPDLGDEARERLLALVERVLADGRFDPTAAEQVFA